MRSTPGSLAAASVARWSYPKRSTLTAAYYTWPKFGRNRPFPSTPITSIRSRVKAAAPAKGAPPYLDPGARADSIQARRTGCVRGSCEGCVRLTPWRWVRLRGWERGGERRRGKANVNARKFETAVEVSWVLELGRGDSKPVGLWALFS